MQSATSTTHTTTTTTTTPPIIGTLQLRSSESTSPAYAQQLEKQGFAVVPSIFSPEECDAYINDAMTWLEGFELGFKRDDRSTWTVENLPPHVRGGMYHSLGLSHEQFIWNIRLKPELIALFATLWDDPNLLCSYDGAVYAIPLPADQIGNTSKPWPHVDQSPLRREKHCIQGIVNFMPNQGKEYGGLMVLKGSLALYKEFFDSHEHEKPEGGWPTYDSYPYTPSQLDWFLARGCEWVHVDAGVGDVILWDSRVIHYGAIPTVDQPRIAQYVCYKPANLMPPEKLLEKQAVFARHGSTSHDPITFRLPPASPALTELRARARREPVLGGVGERLAGVVGY